MLDSVECQISNNNNLYITLDRNNDSDHVTINIDKQLPPDAAAAAATVRVLCDTAAPASDRIPFATLQQ